MMDVIIIIIIDCSSTTATCTGSIGGAPHGIHVDIV